MADSQVYLRMREDDKRFSDNYHFESDQEYCLNCGELEDECTCSSEDEEDSE